MLLLRLLLLLFAVAVANAVAVAAAVAVAVAVAAVYFHSFGAAAAAADYCTGCRIVLYLTGPEDVLEEDGRPAGHYRSCVRICVGKGVCIYDYYLLN